MSEKLDRGMARGRIASIATITSRLGFETGKAVAQVLKDAGLALDELDAADAKNTELKTEVENSPNPLACIAANNLIETQRIRIAELAAALRENRQGYLNILETRKLSGEQWGQRDGYGGRYGALTREEIEEAIAKTDAALAKVPSE